MPREKLQAKKRDILGKKVKKLRREGIIPGVIYGPKIESIHIQFDLKEFQALYSEMGETTVFDIHVDEEMHPVMIKQVQIHPLSDLPLHIDFYKVNLKQKVTVNVPVEFIGEAVAVKSGDGMLLELINEVEVEAFPTEIPSSFEIDVTDLKEVGDTILVSAIKTSEGLEIKVSMDEILCKIEEPQMEEIIEEVSSVDEVEVTTEKSEDEKEKETEETTE